MPAGSTYCIAEGMLREPLQNYPSPGAMGGNYVTFDLRNQFLHPNHPLGWIRELGIRSTVKHVRSRIIFRAASAVVSSEPSAHHHRCLVAHGGDRDPLFEPSTVGRGRHAISCRFAVSLFVNTPKIDLDDLWPSLPQEISAELTCAG